MYLGGFGHLLKRQVRKRCNQDVVPSCEKHRHLVPKWAFCAPVMDYPVGIK